jgi:hypothetical protein
VANTMITGFDSSGEPELRTSNDGALEIVFNFMPPLNGADDPNPHHAFATFEVVLAKALSVDVIRDDRELFIIPKPRADTMDNAQVFLETFWSKASPTLSKAAS